MTNIRMIGINAENPPAPAPAWPPWPIAYAIFIVNKIPPFFCYDCETVEKHPVSLNFGVRSKIVTNPFRLKSIQCLMSLQKMKLRVSVRRKLKSSRLQLPDHFRRSQHAGYHQLKRAGACSRYVCVLGHSQFWKS